jgi:hypothetical protein
MKPTTPLLIVFLFAAAQALAQPISEAAFDVTFNDKVIGTVKATEKKEGSKIIKDLRSNTDTKVLIMSIHVESEVNATYDKETFLNGVAYRHANRGAKDIHATTTRLAAQKYQTDKDGAKKTLQGKDVKYCVIDLYFKEPKGIKEIYSNMFATFVQVKELAPGKYMIMNPDQVNATYSYTGGKLMKIEVDTKVGKVTSIRK